MTADLPPIELERLRRRTVWALVAGVALGSTGHIAAATVATIAAKQIAGTSAWSGAPGAAVVMGAAVGAVALSQVMVRRGRRFGLAAGYALGVLGAFVGTAAIVLASLPLLLVGTFLIGFGNASNQLSRYTAADLVPPERHASAIGVGRVGRDHRGGRRAEPRRTRRRPRRRPRPARAQLARISCRWPSSAPPR